jgi:hypothetical protein
MNLTQYLVDGEKVVAGTSAYDDKDAMSEGKKGEIACTTNRVVFVRKNNVIDISLNAVNSVEYNAPSYPIRYAYWGIGEICLSFLVALIPHEVSNVGAIMLFVAGMATMLAGLLFRRGVLKLHTPNKTYEFATNNSSLEQIVHALRGYEHKQ